MRKKESFFWTSYSDLMTSLFFVMLVLFVLVIVLLYKQMEATKFKLQATENQIEEIKKVEQSTKDLSHDYFTYRPDYKKFVLNIQVRYPAEKFDLNDMVSPDKEKTLEQLEKAGREIQSFLDRHKENQYILIIEGQASRDFPPFNYPYNYELSYQRSLALVRFWMKDKKISFNKNCEILISGSGDGTIDTHSMREKDELKNQRFLIHILPKNIFENNEDQ